MRYVVLNLQRFPEADAQVEMQQTVHTPKPNDAACTEICKIEKPKSGDDD